MGNEKVTKYVIGLEFFKKKSADICFSQQQKCLRKSILEEFLSDSNGIHQEL